MIRLVNMNMAFLALTVAIAFGNYQVKYDVQRKAERVAALTREIAEEQQRQRLLMADWSLLNEPQRLQELAGKYLDLTHVKASQVASAAELPERLAALSAPADAARGAAPVIVRLDARGSTRLALNR